MIRDILDNLIAISDRGLRSMTGVGNLAVDSTEHPAPPKLSEADRIRASSLMRINHCGEVCAQALYEGQALAAKSPEVKQQLKQAADEERKHLSLCRMRLEELNAQPSIFEPLFYIASTAIGVVTGQLGDRVSLGFVEATEDEVCKHLDRHIDEIGDSDTRTAAILKTIRADEAKHQNTARETGGNVFAKPVKSSMALSAKVMTRLTSII